MAQLIRRPDWHARLTGYLSAAARLPFKEGSFDCALFAAGAVEVMTGTDLAQAWRGTYASTAEGLLALRRAGHADHLALVESLLPACRPLRCRPGDLSAVPGEDGPALGVVQGDAVFVLTPARLALVPLLVATHGWRVG